MKQIEEIMKKIDWNSSSEDKNKGIKLAKKVKNLDFFMQPCSEHYNKNVWEGCAIIISNRNDEELKPYIEKMLDWLQDMNWPGYKIIFDRMCNMKANILIEEYNKCVEKALKNKDYNWLTYLAGLLKNKELHNIIDKGQRNILEKYYDKYIKLT